MTRLNFANLIRSYTKQTSISLVDSDILLLANPVKDDLAELIASRDIKGNYFILPTLDNLIAGQREYAFPDDMLDHMFSLEVAFSNKVDSQGQLPYVLARKDDFRRFNLARTEANIQAAYTNGGGSFVIDSFSASGKPSTVAYEVQRRSIYLLSGDISSATLLDVNGNVGATSVANGLRLRYRAYPADLPDVSDNIVDMSIDPTPTTFGFPRQFHELWARRCAIVWKAQHPGAVPVSQLEQLYPQDLEDKLSGMSENDLSEELLGRIPAETGWDY